jgi:hypothetical protein
LPSHKEAHRVFWMVKGSFDTVTEETVFDCYNSYTKRLWYNEEAYRYEDGFEKAYEKKFK